VRIGTMDVGARTADEAIAGALSAERDGLDTYWAPGGWRDPLTLLAVAGQHAHRVRLGAGIVSTYAAHPTAVAEQALTVSSAIGGRLVLGIGISHPHMVEQRFGASFEKPIRYLREFLTILGSLLDTGSVDFTGEVLSAHTELRIKGVERPPVVVAALSGLGLRVSGRLADGALTNFLGPRILATEIIPTISAAAQEAGRPPPRMIASMPVLVTNDGVSGRDKASEYLGVYLTRYTAYRSTFERQGVDGPASLAIVGDEEAVAAELARYADIGIEEFAAHPFGTPEDQVRTLKFVATLTSAPGSVGSR
jgi:5,10-methylenetetrahydromethanopterin reductase